MAKRSKKKKATGGGASTKVAVTDSVGLRPLPWFRRDCFFGLILVLLVILAYQPVWYAGFIWDDDDHVTANPCIVGPLGLKEIWTTSCANFFPLSLTTFWVEHAMWGLEPLPYHLVNVVMHGACAVVFWRVLRSLQVPGAWLGAALWALHPVEVESVAWISELKNTQSCFFYLLTILFFVRWLRARDFDRRSGGAWNYGLTLLFAALAMASKSSTVILPVVLCLSAWWLEGRWRWRNLSRVAPIILMSVIASVLSIWVQKLELASLPDPQWVRSWPERVATAGDAVWFYLGKLLWPYPLITIYPRWQIDAGLWISYLPTLAVIVVFLILWLKHESWARPWFFVFAYFLLALLPALGLADNSIFRYSLVFDHFQYLASMGPLALAGAGMIRWAQLALPGRPAVQGTLGAGLLLILGLVSWQRTWVYENQETLWDDTLARNPNCWAAHNNLGSFLYQKGEADAAMPHFQKAVEINPYDAEAYCNLGLVFLHKGRLHEAIAEFQKTVEIKPNYAGGQNCLGGTLYQNGQVDEAIAQFRKAVAINPTEADFHNNLGVALFKKGQVDEAIAQLREALRLRPDYRSAQDSLAKAEAAARKASGSK